MSIIDIVKQIPSIFYSVFTCETKSLDDTKNLYDEIFSSCSCFYRFNIDKKQIENSSKSLHINENSLYGTILFNNNSTETIIIVSFKSIKGIIFNYIFITHQYILEAASYSGIVESVLYTNGCVYKRKTQKDFNIYNEIDINLYKILSEEIKLKQLILI